MQKSEIALASLQLRPNEQQLLMNVLIFKFIDIVAIECEPQCVT